MKVTLHPIKNPAVKYGTAGNSVSVQADVEKEDGATALGQLLVFDNDGVFSDCVTLRIGSDGVLSLSRAAIKKTAKKTPGAK